MLETKQPHMSIRNSIFLILSLSFLSCNSIVSDHQAQQGNSLSSERDLLDDASKFSEKILGERLRVHYTEYKRGELGVDALFGSEEMIGYTTFSNDLYQKVRGPVDLKDCILFAANYKSEDSAKQAFNFLKANSVIRASEVEGMVGPTPVQVRFLEKIRNDGDGGMLTQQGSYVFFLFEFGEVPPITTNWKDYENLFLESFADNDESMEPIRLRKGSFTR